MLFCFFYCRILATFDDPLPIVSPCGVGFDINCGVRLLRTNLIEQDVKPIQEHLDQALFDHICLG